MSEDAVSQHTEVDVRGPVHVLDAGGPTRPSGRPPLVLVHGLDGSAANWWDVAPELARHHRVVAPDLPGFGRTPLRWRRRSVTAHANLVVEVLRRSVLAEHGPAVLVGNSMGAGFRRHAAPPEEQVRRLLALCVAGPRHGSPAAIAEMVDVARHRGRLDHARVWGGSARSLFTSLCRRGAFHRLADQVSAPVLVVEGGADPIVPAASIAALRRRHPTWQHVAMPGVGHVPQLEDPDGLVAHLEAFTRPWDAGSRSSA